MRHAIWFVLPWLAGCSLTGVMIPVAGPLSAVRPVPVVTFKATGILGNNGGLEITLPDGVKCRGRWSSAAGAGVTVGSGTLISEYGTTYASGTSVSTGTGSNPGQGIATCANGQTMQFEFVTGAGTAHGFGFGKDSDGTLYRFVF